MKRPVWGSVKQNWEQRQINVLTGAEEFELVENYKMALNERDRKLAKKKSQESNQGNGGAG